MSEFPLILLLPPEGLPQSFEEMSQQRTEKTSEVLKSGLWGPWILSDSETLDCVRTALNTLPPPQRSAFVRRPKKLIADSDSHDEYFHIERTTAGRPLDILTRSILRSYEELLEDKTEGGTSLSPEQWREIRAAFHSMLRFLSGDLTTETVWVDEEAEAVESRQGCDPLTRWLRGHHVFLIFIQSLITSLNCFVSAYKSRERNLSAFILDLTTVLFDGCSAALHFAGDFSAAEYKADVRPTMMPPQALPGMSGVLAQDHEYLVRMLKSQKELFSSLDPSLKDHYMRFVNAFGNTYEAHKLVCSRFVGDEQPSILRRSEEAEAAVDVLDKVKNIRIRSFHEI